MMWVFCIIPTSAQSLPLLSLPFGLSLSTSSCLQKLQRHFYFWYLQWLFHTFAKFLYHPMHACMHSVLFCLAINTVCGLWSVIKHFTHVRSTACAFLQVCQMVIEHKTSCVNMNLRNPSISTRWMGSHPPYIRAVTVKRDMILQTSQGPRLMGPFWPLSPVPSITAVTSKEHEGIEDTLSKTSVSSCNCAFFINVNEWSVIIVFHLLALRSFSYYIYDCRKEWHNNIKSVSQLFTAMQMLLISF